MCGRLRARISQRCFAALASCPWRKGLNSLSNSDGPPFVDTLEAVVRRFIAGFFSALVFAQSSGIALAGFARTEDTLSAVQAPPPSFNQKLPQRSAPIPDFRGLLAPTPAIRHAKPLALLPRGSSKNAFAITPDPLAIPHGVQTQGLRRRSFGMVSEMGAPLFRRAADAAPSTAMPASATGMNDWWSYTGGAIPGMGPWMMNPANGNLILQATDVDVPERGLDLVFSRTWRFIRETGYANDVYGSIQPSRRSFRPYSI